MDCTKINLKKGSKGADVKELQKYMTYIKVYDGNIDGEFGTYTENAVKKMQDMYGNSADGVFGSKTCKKCGINGQDISNSIQAIPVDQFENMLTRFDEYVKSNKKEPNICYVDISNKYRYVSKDKLKEMRKRYDAYIKKNGRKPNVCYVNYPTTVESNRFTNDSFIKAFKDAVGDFSTYKEAYNKLKGRGYIGYNNDIYDQKTALKRLKNRQGLNCSDSCQLMYALAVAMGISVRYKHIMCRSGTGHIQLDVKYPSGVSSWTTIDPAAALSKGSQYAFGRVWCSNGRLLAYNPQWLMTDDGRT